MHTLKGTSKNRCSCKLGPAALAAGPTKSYCSVGFAALYPPYIWIIRGSLKSIYLHRRRQGLSAAFLALLVVGHHVGYAAEPSPPAAEFPHDLMARAARLPDGSVFLPKPAQHVLGVRTVLVQPASMPATVELAGRVVRDPNFSGTVQAIQAGVVEAPPGGLPNLGQRVTKGQLLGNLRPVLTSMDRSQTEAQLAIVNKDVFLNQKLLERVREQAVTGGINISIQQETAMIEYKGLLARKSALEAALAGTPQPLRAPVSGVISRSEAALGKVVAGGDTLFEIVDPARLWVEALNYDMHLVGRVSAATALGPNGAVIGLTYMGQSYELRNQAVPLQFRALTTADQALAVGQNLKVYVQTKDTVQGFLVAHAAVTRGAESTDVVWVHHAAEIFTPHVVRTVVAGTDQVLVVSGLSAGDRVVTVGASAFAQAR